MFKTGFTLEKKIIIILILLLGITGTLIGIKVLPSLSKTKVVRNVSSRLKARSRKADILVTEVVFNEGVKKLRTSIRYKSALTATGLQLRCGTLDR